MGSSFNTLGTKLGILGSTENFRFKSILKQVSCFDPYYKREHNKIVNMTKNIFFSSHKHKLHTECSETDFLYFFNYIFFLAELYFYEYFSRCFNSLKHQNIHFLYRDFNTYPGIFVYVGRSGRIGRLWKKNIIIMQTLYSTQYTNVQVQSDTFFVVEILIV